MRLVPPKTRKKVFTEKEFKEYLLDHQLVTQDWNAPLRGMMISLSEERGVDQAINHICEMLPLEYQERAKEIFTKWLKEMTTNPI